MKKDQTNKKEEFIQKISNLSRDDIDTLIQNRGKKAKKLQLFHVVRE